MVAPYAPTHRNGEGGPGMQAAGKVYKCGAPWAAEGYANAFIGRGAIQLTWNINYGTCPHPSL